MKNQRYKSGFAHIIIVAILVIALVGVLGFVVWKNYSNSKSVSKTSTKSNNSIGNNNDTSLASNSKENNSTNNSGNGSNDSSSANVITTITTDNPGTASDYTFSTGMSVKFPENWTLAHTVDKTTSLGVTQSDDKSVITSPDDKVIVTMDINNYELGFNPGDPEIVLLETDSIDNYSGVRFVEYVYYYKDNNSYTYHIGAQNDSTAVRSVKLGDLVSIANNDFVYGMWISGNGGDLHTSLTISFKNHGGESVSSLNELSQLMSNENYRVAKQIVQSLYIKE